MSLRHWGMNELWDEVQQKVEVKEKGKEKDMRENENIMMWTFWNLIGAIGRNPWWYPYLSWWGETMPEAVNDDCGQM